MAWDAISHEDAVLFALNGSASGNGTISAFGGVSEEVAAASDGELLTAVIEERSVRFERQGSSGGTEPVGPPSGFPLLNAARSVSRCMRTAHPVQVTRAEIARALKCDTLCDRHRRVPLEQPQARVLRRL